MVIVVLYKCGHDVSSYRGKRHAHAEELGFRDFPSLFLVKW